MKYILSLCLAILLFGCATPEKAAKPAAQLAPEKVNWKKINQDVLHKVRKKKGNEFDDLVNWVVTEVQHKVPKHNNWQAVNKEVLKEYNYKKQHKEYEELIIWVIDEVKDKIKSDKYVITEDQLNNQPTQPQKLFSK